MQSAEDRLSRQQRKRLATRQSISDAATRLFIEHGFDNVTIDQIADAADVSRMTVFNHFARKEDMFFDLDEQARQAMLAALAARGSTSPVEALRLFILAAVGKDQPFANILSPESYRFMAAVQPSEALKARARAIRDEIVDDLSEALTQSVKRPAADPAAVLAASLLVATWTVALNHAHHQFGRKGHTAQARRAFRDLIDQGTRGVEAALAGTPYV